MNHRLNVLFVTPWYPSASNGARGVFVREHAKAVARDHNVAVIHSAGRPADGRSSCVCEENRDSELTDGLPTYVMYHGKVPAPLLTRANEFRCLRRLARRVEAEHFRPDIIHANVYNVALISLLLARLYRVPLVISEHSSAFPRKLLTPRDRRYARFAFSRAAAVMPVSRALQAGMEENGIRANFQIVPNVVDTARFHPAAPAPEPRPGRRLLTVGNMPASEVKGYPYLLDALSRLPADEDWTLEIIGDGPMRSAYEDQAAARGLAGKVQFRGYQPKHAIVAAMQEADLFVLASTWDNMPCVLIEAMATGLPICATRVGGIPEMVEPEIGLLAAPGDAESLRTCLATMLATLDRYDPAVISRIADARYSMPVIGKQFDTIYQQALG